jgi:excisionase family DNA binding protein
MESDTVEAGAVARPRRWAHLDAAAQYSGLSINTLRRLRDEGRLHFYRPRGGRTLLDLCELDAAIAASVESGY